GRRAGTWLLSQQGAGHLPPSPSWGGTARRRRAGWGGVDQIRSMALVTDSPTPTAAQSTLPMKGREAPRRRLLLSSSCRGSDFGLGVAALAGGRVLGAGPFDAVVAVLGRVDHGGAGAQAALLAVLAEELGAERSGGRRRLDLGRRGRLGRRLHRNRQARGGG